MVNEDDAVTMVDFVLQDARQESVSFDADFVAVDIDGFNADFAVAGNFAVKVLDAQAAFVIIDDFALVFDDFRIYQRDKILIFFVFEISTDDDDSF